MELNFLRRYENQQQIISEMLYFYLKMVDQSRGAGNHSIHAQATTPMC